MVHFSASFAQWCAKWCATPIRIRTPARKRFDAASDSGDLVGDQFTLADLTSAALSYPLIWPEQALGARYANTRREDLLAWHLRWKGHGIEDYVARIYRDHRHSAQTP